MLIGCFSSSLNNDNPLNLKLSISDVSNTRLKLTYNQSASHLNAKVTTDLKYGYFFGHCIGLLMENY